MSIDEEKTCNMHTKEKDNQKSGTCCQIKEKDDAEALTYENETKRSNNE